MAAARWALLSLFLGLSKARPPPRSWSDELVHFIDPRVIDAIDALPWRAGGMPPAPPSPPSAPHLCSSIPLWEWWWWNPIAWFDWAMGIGNPCYQEDDILPLDSTGLDATPAQAISPANSVGDGTNFNSGIEYADMGSGEFATAPFSEEGSGLMYTPEDTNGTVWMLRTDQEKTIAGGGLFAIMVIIGAALSRRGTRKRGGSLLASGSLRSDDPSPSSVGQVEAGLRPKPSRGPPPTWWIRSRQWGVDLK